MRRMFAAASAALFSGLLFVALLASFIAGPAHAAGKWRPGATAAISRGLFCIDADAALESLRLAIEGVKAGMAVPDYLDAVGRLGCVAYAGEATFVGLANDVVVEDGPRTFYIGKWRIAGAELFEFVSAGSVDLGPGV